MRAYRLSIDDAAAPSPEEEQLPPDPEVPPRRVPVPVAPSQPREERVGEGTGREDVDPDRAMPRSPVERLRPGMVDPRLWERPEAPPPPERTDIERARDRVYARIQMLNDSLAVEGELARRGTDWTFTDKDGKKWGVSPGKVHLGGVTLPLPIGFSPPPDQAREARERASREGEIRDHADRARIRRTFDEQVRATREERDRARSARRDSTKAGGTD